LRHQFSKLIKSLLPDEDYRHLQEALLLRPEMGNVIPGTGGLRKIRWRTQGSGKRGGLRVIYYLYTSENTFYMLTAYKKSDKEDLTKDQLKVLGKLVEEWLT
jgi:hypothetical protein